MPEVITIQAKNVDAAAGEIIGILEDTSKGNVIFVHGWGGIGASAALKAVAQRLKSSKSKFDRVVHVDCSLWKSMRALQKAVAEELELPASMMSIFDQQDKEDDFSGIDEGARGVIADITVEIFRKLAGSRFVVIFHNGSDKYINLNYCGVPTISFWSIKVLWTWYGRFQSKYIFFPLERLHIDVVVDYSHDDCIGDEALLEEAKEVVAYMGIPEPYMNHMIVEKCFQYAYALGPASAFNWGNWENHAYNYFVCDGIIQGQGDTSAWGVADALQRNTCMDQFCYYRIPTDVLHHKLRDRLVYVEHKKGLLPDGFGMALSEVTSFFVGPYNYDNQMVTLPDGIFQHSYSSKLRVLHLSGCRFSFESPPFICCSQLIFLQLKACKNIPSDKNPSHNKEMTCFQKLWVLHLRDTNWYQLLSEEMMNFMADLRELDVEQVEGWSIGNLRGRFPSLVKVHVHEIDSTTKEYHLPDLSSAHFLKTVILDSCVEPEQVVPGVLPPMFESFTFHNFADHTAKISSISFRGCSQLKSILLIGDLGRLHELDLSGTTVKILDLREVSAPNLKRLTLLGCEKLCAILWPPKDKMTQVLEVLHINTIRSTSPTEANWKEKPRHPIAAVGSSYIYVATATELGISRHASFDFKWYISPRDTRILRSLEPVKNIEHNHVYMEMGSSPTSGATVGDSEAAQEIWSLCRPNNYLYARGVCFQSDLRVGAENEGAISWMWDCPAIPTPTAQDLYIHIQDSQETKRGLLQQQQSNIEGINISADLPSRFVFNNARMLHVHDSSSITCITCPQGSYWRSLEWCRVERCPELHTVFRTSQQSLGDSFCHQLSIFWASQLLKARYIWYWSAMRVFSSVNIVLLHLDYCPRLIHVLPLSESVDSLPCLDTLEIVCCGDLREVFALDPKQKEHKVIQLPKLRRIHLYELPSLRRICGSRMFAPNLETVKIRGCLGLPLSIYRLKRQDLLPLIDKFSNKMKGWKPNKMMATAGRLTLTRSVLMALPIHLMEVLPMPAWAIKIINRRCRGFIWKGEEEINGGHCLLPWARVCMPMEFGGLGIINLKWFGFALRCRWPWLSWDADERPWHGLPDTTEKEVEALFTAACRIQLGTGEMAKFWTDKWLADGHSIAEMAPHLFSFVNDRGRSVKEALHNPIWTRDIAGGLSLPAIAQYLKVWDLAHATALGVGVRDTPRWILTADHQFSVQSAYRMFFLGNTRFACAKPIWKSKAPPRCKFFMWLAVHRRCLTADNLERRHWPSNGSCPLCLSEPEDCTHLFVHCRFTQQLWLRFKSWTSADFQVPDDSVASTEDWWLQARAAIPKPVRRNFDTIVILLH